MGTQIKIMFVVCYINMSTVFYSLWSKIPKGSLKKIDIELCWNLYIVPILPFV
ncbi:hypothetical protein HanRHA438_Chr15g0732961 [Helianthus annuus]|nr:hypothetical protein HanRHA438_Chr15g0732961 [Helianthus annuus]